MVLISTLLLEMLGSAKKSTLMMYNCLSNKIIDGNNKESPPVHSSPSQASGYYGLIPQNAVKIVFSFIGVRVEKNAAGAILRMIVCV